MLNTGRDGFESGADRLGVVPALAILLIGGLVASTLGFPKDGAVGVVGVASLDLANVVVLCDLTCFVATLAVRLEAESLESLALVVRLCGATRCVVGC